MSEKKQRSLKTYLLTGILVTTPLAITVYLASELIRFIDNSVSGLIPPKYNPETYLPYGVPGLGIVVLVLSLILIGMLSSGFLGSFVLQIMNKTISKMPVVSGLYTALKKIMETVIGNGNTSAFRQAVLVQYPRKGLWTIAFITGEVYSKVQKNVKQKLVSIYVPTTPNPTSGFLIFVPQTEAIPLDISVEDAWKIIISTGIVTPDNPDTEDGVISSAIEKAKTLAEHEDTSEKE